MNNTMKTALLVSIMLLTLAAPAQTTLVSWNFSGSSSTATGGLAANAARTVTNNAAGTTSFPGTDNGTCPAPYILNSNWTGGSGSKYWQFSFASTGYSTISITFDSRGSNTGPKDFKLEISTTSAGSGYADVPSASYAINADNACHSYGGFSLPSSADNKANVYIRLIMTSNVSVDGGTLATGGTSGLDNVVVAAAVVLPIDLIGLTAKGQGDQSLLSFSTAIERNNDYFSIERSNDGTRFEAIGKVTGAGTSTVQQDYQFTDERPLKGVNFYRLKQVDFDGQFSYSPVVSVTFGQAGGLHLAPQPVADQLQVNLDQAIDQDGQWQVYDFSGRLLQSGTLEVESLDFRIPTATFTQGTYLLRVVNGQSVMTQQFQKQ